MRLKERPKTGTGPVRVSWLFDRWLVVHGVNDVKVEEEIQKIKD